MALFLVISILTLDMSVIIHQILPAFIYFFFIIVNLAKKLIFNPLLPHFLTN